MRSFPKTDDIDVLLDTTIEFLPRSILDIMMVAPFWSSTVILTFYSDGKIQIKEKQRPPVRVKTIDALRTYLRKRAKFIIDPTPT